MAQRLERLKRTYSTLLGSSGYQATFIGRSGAAVRTFEENVLNSLRFQWLSGNMYRAEWRSG